MENEKRTVSLGLWRGYLVEVEGWKGGKGKEKSSVTMGRRVTEGMWLRWKDGKGKEHVIRGNEESGRRGYVVEVEGWKREKWFRDTSYLQRHG